MLRGANRQNLQAMHGYAENEIMVQTRTCAAKHLILADDHPLFRHGLIEATQANWPGLVMEEAGSISELLHLLGRRHDIDLVLLDLRLPDSADLGGLRTLRERFPATPVAVISAIEDNFTITGALRQGAMGFIPKSSSMPVLVDALARIFCGDIYTPTSFGKAAPCTSDLVARAGLSPAQMRIISGLERGLLNKQIAFELGLTEHTVKAHLTAAFRKLGVENRLQATLLLRGENGPTS